MHIYMHGPTIVLRYGYGRLSLTHACMHQHDRVHESRYNTQYMSFSLILKMHVARIESTDICNSSILYYELDY